MANSRPAAAPRPVQSATDSSIAEQGLDEVDVASAASMDASDPPAFGGATGVGAIEDEGDERQRRISERAHELWQEAGSPDGVALDFWLTAEREIDGDDAPNGADA